MLYWLRDGPLKKLWGKWGIFEPQEFFSLSNSLYEFVLGRIFFRVNWRAWIFFVYFPLREYFFFVPRPPPPPPHKFSNGPSLKLWKINITPITYQLHVNGLFSRQRCSGGFLMMLDLSKHRAAIQSDCDFCQTSAMPIFTRLPLAFRQKHILSWMNLVCKERAVLRQKWQNIKDSTL